MDTPLKKKLAALGMVAGLLALVAGAMVSFAGGFTPTETVTVLAPRAGLVMAPDAKVTMRGVEVGRVRTVSHDGASAELALDMNPDRMDLVPANVGVAIRSTTVFGAKFVDLVPPADPDPRSLAPGAVIAADDVTVEFDTLFQHLSDVLRKIEPEKVNATLGAIAEALRGRGAGLGESLDDAARLTRVLTESMPALEHDLESGAQVAGLYADVAPDLLRILDAGTDVGNTVVDRQADLDVLLSDVIGLASTGRDVLRENEDGLVTALGSLAHTSRLLGEYSPVLTCFIVGLDQARQKFEPMTGTGQYSAITLSTSFMGGATAYSADRGDLPVVNAGGGPNCHGMPDFDPRRDGAAPYLVTDSSEVPLVPTTVPEIRYPTIFSVLLGDAIGGTG